jgi:DNA-binding NtrC family response regulator
MANCIVLVDDEQPILEIQQEALSQINLTAQAFVDPMVAWERIQQGDVSLVVTDWNMPQMTGMDLLFKTRSLQRPPHVIIVTAFGTIPRAIQAINEGAFNFLEKPFDIERYQTLVKDAIEHYRRSTVSAVDVVRKSKHRIEPNSSNPIVRSSNMCEVLDRAQSAAPTDSTVLLLGESGTGKEVLADYIHRNSQRLKSPIIKVNCGALPEHLMESELFGHEKGAFTGADRRNIGRFEQASGGTLFLDEIGDLLLPLQVKLLRALQERTIERIGSSAPIPVDFRLICATHCDLKVAIAEKRFREDLFYRINVVPIRIPSLRERHEDIEPLAQHFFAMMRNRLPNGPENLSEEAVAVLNDYSWPGNVRQLRNAIEYALVLCKSQIIKPDDLPEDVRSVQSKLVSSPISSQTVPTIQKQLQGSTVGDKANPVGLKNSVQQAEEEAIRAALQRLHWRMASVARELKISRSTLYARMELYGIKRPD